jgi:energy-converting hydrogenase Eha subunit G
MVRVATFVLEFWQILMALDNLGINFWAFGFSTTFTPPY